MHRRAVTGWLEGPRRANALAVAASILLVAGAVLWGVYGRPIDAMSNRAEAAPDPTLMGAAGQAAREHHECEVDERMLLEKMTVDELPAAQARLISYLGEPLPLDEIRPEGFVFLAAGAARLPGDEPSAQVIFTRARPTADPIFASLFFQRDAGRYLLDGQPLQPTRWYEVEGPQLGRMKVWCGTDGRLFCFVVCSRADDLPGVAEAVGAAMWRLSRDSQAGPDGRSDRER